MLRCFTPTEKAELDAWADQHDKPTGPFLLSRLRDLKDAEEHKRPAHQSREHELRAEIVALQEELRLTKAALQRAEILRAVPTSGLRDYSDQKTFKSANGVFDASPPKVPT